MLINTRELKAELIKSGYTQSALANKMNMAKNTLNSRINGRSNISTEEVKRMCEILQIPQERMIKIFFN